MRLMYMEANQHTHPRTNKQTNKSRNSEADQSGIVGHACGKRQAFKFLLLQSNKWEDF